MNIRILALSACVLFTGCASNALYQWGGYDDHLYATYKDPSKVEVLRAKLEAQIQASQAAGRKVAPGLYAELGTIYLQAGNRPQALRYYELEKTHWPESTVLMTAMIQNIERLEKDAQEEKK